MASTREKLERQIEQNGDRLATIEKQLTPIIQRRDKELNDLGTVTSDTAQQVKGLGDQYVEVKETLDNLQAAVERLETAPGKVDKATDERREKLSLAWQVWGAGEVKDLRSRLSRQTPDSALCKPGRLWTPRSIRARASHPAMREQVTRAELERELRALSLGLDDDSIGDAVHTYFAGIFESPHWMPIMRQICGLRTTTMANAVQDDRETDEAILGARISAAAGGAQADVVVDEIEGFSTSAPFNEVRIKRDGGSTTTHIIQSIDTATKTLTMTANLGTAAAEGDLVLANAVVETSECALIPQAYDEITAATFPIIKLAIAKKVSVEKLQDIAAFSAWIERRLLNKIGRAEDLNIFYGPGGSGITGVFNDADVASDTYVPGSETLLDFLVDQFYAIAERDFVATDTIVSVDVHRRLTQSKASDGHYLLWMDLGSTIGTALHMTRLHMSRALIATDALMGAFPDAITLHESMDATVEIGTEDKDLRRAKRTVVAMERFASAINYPGALQRCSIPVA